MDLIFYFKPSDGGGTITGGVYSVSGTSGQPDASGAMSGGNYSVAGWTLQTNANLATPTWGNYLGTVVNNSVTNAPPKGNLFFRLKQ